MTPRHFISAVLAGALALLLAGAASGADDGCPSLSGCSYQAGRGLPAQEPAVRQPPAPESRPPVIINSCDAGGCVDPNGARYNGRAAEPESGVYLDPQGRRCVRSGDFLQCG
ncbi:hypothetical protein [Noviherbaspirillum suwonense]|jgi:hypothetical protein|uniref:Secreted protein n=1 Tax=Noviherbaspirillum suwonense TaxID=1224511 RepID=A0ABY1QFU6_9BURK|nr:hypothetical protein [Noviherbaspirillum suwonense]SMP70068.1 hypothetical protein SAMN06295970_115134 [Noviherbaspirillum suwonense]